MKDENTEHLNVIRDAYIKVAEITRTVAQGSCDEMLIDVVEKREELLKTVMESELRIEKRIPGWKKIFNSSGKYHGLLEEIRNAIHMVLDCDMHIQSVFRNRINEIGNELSCLSGQAAAVTAYTVHKRRF